jgi:hypothetical protein
MNTGMNDTQRHGGRRRRPIAGTAFVALLALLPTGSPAWAARSGTIDGVIQSVTTDSARYFVLILTDGTRLCVPGNVLPAGGDRDGDNELRVGKAIRATYRQEGDRTVATTIDVDEAWMN